MDTENTTPAQLRGLRLILGRHNKALSGRAFTELARMSLGNLRSAEAGIRPLSQEDRRRIAYWIGAEWDEKQAGWVYTHDHRIPFSRDLYALYSATQFSDPHARDVDAHMAALALIYLLQALPGESYRYTLFLLHDSLQQLAGEFAPEAISTLERLRPRLTAAFNVKDGTLAFSVIDHPHCQKVPGSEVLGPRNEDRTLNFHALRLTNPKRKKPYASRSSP